MGLHRRGAEGLSPFVVLAGERPVDELADGARLTEVIQQDHQRHIGRARLPVDLVGQVGQVQLKILEQTGRVLRVGPWHDGHGDHGTRAHRDTAACPHLAGLLVHVEGADDALGDVPTRALHQVLSQAVGQVGLAGATGPREDEAAVLQQEADVVLHHGLGDECFEHQAVHTLLFQACGQGRAEGPLTPCNTPRQQGHGTAMEPLCHTDL